MKRFSTLLALATALVLATTGCFRVSSDTRALRDAALEGAFGQAHEKIEVGVGFFTVGLAKIASRFIELPDEARLALSSLRNAECAVYEISQPSQDLSAILTRADEAMGSRGYERLVGVVKGRQLVAVYVPGDESSLGVLHASVLVLDHRQLVCATAEAYADELIALATSKLNEERGRNRSRFVAGQD